MTIIVSSPTTIDAVEQKDTTNVSVSIIEKVYLDAIDASDVVVSSVSIDPITGVMSATDAPDKIGHVLYWSQSASSSSTDRFPYLSYYYSSPTRLRAFYSTELNAIYKRRLVFQAALAVTDNSINYAELFYNGTGDKRDKASVQVKIADADISFGLTEPSDGTFIYAGAITEAYLQDYTELPDAAEFASDINDFLNLDALESPDIVNLQQETRECELASTDIADVSFVNAEIVAFSDLIATDSQDIIDISPNALWSDRQSTPQTTWEKVA